jgi:hypothetical protein
MIITKNEPLLRGVKKQFPISMLKIGGSTMKSDTFLSLSSVLTGKNDLAAGRAAAFRLRLDAHFATDLSELLAAFEAHLKTRTPEDSLKDALSEAGTADKVLLQRHAVCRAIVWIWYTGQFVTPYELPDGPQTPEEYADGLLWEVIRAHAPGFHPGGYGAWARLPEVTNAPQQQEK